MEFALTFSAIINAFQKMMDVDQKIESSTLICWREGMKGLHETHFIIIPVKILPLLMPRRRAEK